MDLDHFHKSAQSNYMHHSNYTAKSERSFLQNKRKYDSKGN